MDREAVTDLIAMQNAGRQKAYETEVVDYVDALGMEAEAEAIKNGAIPSEGYDFYMTARAGAVTNPNYSHLSPSFMLEAPMLADAGSSSSLKCSQDWSGWRPDEQMPPSAA